MAENEQPINNKSDHDLLIEVSTKLNRMIDDIKGLNDSVIERTSNLDSCKLDKDVYNQWLTGFYKDYNREISEIKDTIRDGIKEIKESTQKSINDHEKRIRRLEQWGFIAIGAVAVIQIVLKFIN